MKKKGIFVVYTVVRRWSLHPVLFYSGRDSTGRRPFYFIKQAPAGWEGQAGQASPQARATEASLPLPVPCYTRKPSVA